MLVKFGEKFLLVFDNAVAKDLNNTSYEWCSFVSLGIKTARSCHLSVLRMNQTDELATKRLFGVTTLLIADNLISCSRFNSFLSSYRYYCCYFTDVDSVLLQDSSLLCVHGFFR